MIPTVRTRGGQFSEDFDGVVRMVEGIRMRKLISKFYILAFLLIMFSVNSCVLIISTQDGIEVSLYVAEYNSGPAIDGANVELIKNSAVLDKVTTENGKAKFTLKKYSGSYILKITKEGYAVTTIEILNVHAPLTINTTLRKTKFVSAENSINQMSISFDIYTSESKISKILPNSHGVYNLFGLNSLFLIAYSKSTQVPISHMYAKVGSAPGSEYLSSPRLYAESERLEGIINITPFSGRIYLFIDVYDLNDNRYEIVVPLSITKLSTLKFIPYVVEVPQPALYAFNLNMDIKYYSFEDKPEKVPVKTNLYTKITWRKWSESTQRASTNEPDGYVIYKSYDGENYQRLAYVDYTKNYYYDTFNNRPDVRVWYAISAKYASFEGPKTFIGSVVPLPMVYITDVSPVDGATNVSLTPTFSWKITGVERYAGKVKYLYDIWIYDLTVNSRNYYYPEYNSDKAYFTSDSSTISISISNYNWRNLPDGKLQAVKPYEWGPELIAVLWEDWEDSENNSISLSVNCDYNLRVSPVVIEPERYYLFVTGAE